MAECECNQARRPLVMYALYGIVSCIVIACLTACFGCPNRLTCSRYLKRLSSMLCWSPLYTLRRQNPTSEFTPIYTPCSVPTICHPNCLHCCGRGWIEFIDSVHDVQGLAKVVKHIGFGPHSLGPKSEPNPARVTQSVLGLVWVWTKTHPLGF